MGLVTFAWKNHFLQHAENCANTRVFAHPRNSVDIVVFAARSKKQRNFAFHPVVCRWLNNWPQYWASIPFVSFCQLCKPPSFFDVARETGRCHGNMLAISGRHMPSGMVTFSFYCRW